MVELAIIMLSLAVFVSLGTLCFLAYHQMLLTNEVNKRLLVMTMESRSNEAMTYAEVVEAYRQLEDRGVELTQESAAPGKAEAEDAEHFDPFNYLPLEEE